MEAGMDDGIRVREFHEATGTEAWRVIGDGACSFFRTGSFAQSAQLVEAIAGIAGVDDHPPSIDVRADGVTVRLLTTADDWYGMTQRDVELARRITAAARDIGLSGDPSDVQSVLVIPGSIDAKSVMPFWQAAPTRTSSIHATAVRRSGSRTCTSCAAMAVARSMSLSGFRRSRARRG
jgi:4a-hydroxytetrahydrobiopterin dehydratase